MQTSQGQKKIFTIIIVWSIIFCSMCCPFVSWAGFRAKNKKKTFVPNSGPVSSLQKTNTFFQRQVASCFHFFNANPFCHSPFQVPDMITAIQSKTSAKCFSRCHCSFLKRYNQNGLQSTSLIFLFFFFFFLINKTFGVV